MNVRRMVALSVASLSLLAGVATPAAAGDRGVEEGWVVPYPESGLIDTYLSSLVSGDLTTVAFGACSPDPVAAGVTFIDLATAASTTISGSPEGSCQITDLINDAPPAPYPTSLNALAEDGSALVTASWEGLETGDEDEGASDAILVDRRTGARRLLSGSIEGRSVWGRAISDDASRAILWSTASDGSDDKLHLWDSGVLTDIELPNLATISSYVPPTLSGDGRYMFVGRPESGTLLRLDLDTGDSISTPLTGTCCGLVQLAISYDGETAAWVGPPRSEDDLFSNSVTIWNMETTRIHQISGGPIQSAPIHLADDGSRVLGTSRTFAASGDHAPEGYFFWSLDSTTGALTTLVDERPNGGRWMQVDAISGDGQQAVISTMGPIGYETASPKVIQGGRLATRQYLWEASGTPPPHPGSDPTLANQVERLYLAFFGRSADPGGMEHWVSALLGGTDLASVAETFASGEEFTLTYGSLSDEAFVELLYDNVFHRAVDSGGDAYWQGLLASGTTRGTVMASVSESAEFVALTGTVAPRPADESALRRLYAAYFLRTADGDGLVYWLGQNRSGMSLAAISDVFAASPEFADAYGSLEDDRFVKMAYLNVNGRYPDLSGGQYWRQQLEGGLPRGELMVAFSQSPEFINLTVASVP